MEASFEDFVRRSEESLVASLVSNEGILCLLYYISFVLAYKLIPIPSTRHPVQLHLINYEFRLHELMELTVRNILSLIVISALIIASSGLLGPLLEVLNAIVTAISIKLSVVLFNSSLAVAPFFIHSPFEAFVIAFLSRNAHEKGLDRRRGLTCIAFCLALIIIASILECTISKYAALRILCKAIGWVLSSGGG